MTMSIHDTAGIDSNQPADPDPDLAEQAVPGHGIPSQDPNAAAQVGMLPEEAERESKSAFVGGGAIAGLAAGAATGAVVGGPLGVLVGGMVGTLAGVLGGEAAGGLNESEPPAGDNRPATGADDAKTDVPNP